MMQQQEQIANYDLSEFANGAVQEAFNRAMQEVFQNMQDVNTPYKPTRSINIKITFEQNEARDDMNVDVKVDRKLVSATAIKTKMAIAKDLRTGRIIAEEYGKQIKGQMHISDLEPKEETEGKVKEMPKMAVVGGR